MQCVCVIYTTFYMYIAYKMFCGPPPLECKLYEGSIMSVLLTVCLVLAHCSI